MSFVEHYALNLLSGKEFALKQHDMMFVNITLFYSVMLHAKETYKLERLVDGRLITKTLSGYFDYFVSKVLLPDIIGNQW
jgi:hypothetical protein